MTSPIRPAEEPDEAVDVDLDVLDEQLRREAVGDPTVVRVGGSVIHITHANDWSSSAMRAAGAGNWDTWAREVIEDDDEFRLWVEADLKNYQVEAVFAECGRQARLNQGKSRVRSGSRNHSRRK
jgi:hypothetical protein